MDLLKKKLKNVLRAQELIVDFTKKNGDKRSMLCTQHRATITASYPEFVVPEKDSTNPLKNKVRPDDLIVVWDLDKNAWRSFNWSTVTSFEVDKIRWEV